MTEAYDNIRKRLTEERSLRGQIMKQYEKEIEEIQMKTSEILNQLRQQLKQERKEKEEAEYQSEMIMKRLKTIELDMELIEAKNKAESDLDAFMGARAAAGSSKVGSSGAKISSKMIPQGMISIVLCCNEATQILRKHYFGSRFTEN